MSIIVEVNKIILLGTCVFGAMQDNQDVPPAFFSTPFKGMDRYEDGGKKGKWYRTFRPYKEGDEWVGQSLLIPRQAVETH